MQDDNEFKQEISKRRNRKHKRKRISLTDYAEKIRIARILNDYYSRDDD